MPSAKIGWTSSDFIREVDKTGRWSTSDVVQIPEEKFKLVIKDSKNATEMVERLKKANIQEFAIGYAFSDVNTQIKEAQENLMNLMKLKEMIEQRANVAPSEMEKMKKASAEKKLSYID
jgi:hypothetical protein